MEVEPAPRKGFLVSRGVLMNPLGNILARALKSSNFLTFVLANEVHGSGFKIRVREAQNSRGELGSIGEMMGT